MGKKVVEGGEMGHIEIGVCRHVNPEGVCRK